MGSKIDEHVKIVLGNSIFNNFENPRILDSCLTMHVVVVDPSQTK